MNCPKCGCKIPINSNKCGVCGTQVDAGQNNDQAMNKQEDINAGNTQNTQPYPVNTGMGNNAYNVNTNQGGYTTSGAGGYSGGAGYPNSNGHGYGYPGNNGYANSWNQGYGKPAHKSLTPYQIVKIVGASVLLLGSLMPFIAGMNVIMCSVGSIGAIQYSDIYAGTGYEAMYIVFNAALIVQPIILYGAIAALILAIVRNDKTVYKADVTTAKFVLTLELIVALMPLFLAIFLSFEYDSKLNYHCTVGNAFIFIGLIVSYIGCSNK